MVSRVTLLLVILCLGCRSDQATSPITDVELSLTVSPSVAGPDDVAVVTARVLNQGDATLQRGDGCSFWMQGMILAFLDPDSNPIYLSDPRHRPLCPDRIVDFTPGEDLNGTAEFNGIVYSELGEQMVAHSGIYTVIVTFQVWEPDQDDEPRLLESRATFRWRAE